MGRFSYFISSYTPVVTLLYDSHDSFAFLISGIQKKVMSDISEFIGDVMTLEHS